MAPCRRKNWQGAFVLEQLEVLYICQMLVRVNEPKPDHHAIHQIVDCLRAGGLIIYPTDTIYALGCDLFNHKAFEKLCKMKGIKPDKANFSFVCANLSHLSEFTRPIANDVFRVMKKALPGPYTFILEASSEVPKVLKQNRKTVGIRVPNNLVCTEIIEKLGHPLVSTSLHDAKDHITEYHNDPAAIWEEFGDKVDMVVDAGFGNLFPSTVIDCSKGEFEVVREGLGSLEVLN